MKSILNFLDRDFTLSKRQVIWIMLALVVIGLGLRLTYWTIRERPPRDEKVYIQTVENINNGDKDWQKKSGYMPPLMPYTASNVCKFGIAPETALHTLNMLYAMLWVLVMFFLCRDVFDNDKAGLLGMTIAAFNPYSIRMACQIMREPLYILLFTLSLWCAVKYIKNRGLNPLYPFLLAAFAVLGFFTRYEGIEIALFLPLAIVIIYFQYKWQYAKRCAYGLGIYLFTMGFIAGGLYSFDNAYTYSANQKAIGNFWQFVGNKHK